MHKPPVLPQPVICSDSFDSDSYDEAKNLKRLAGSTNDQQTKTNNKILL